MSAEDKYQIAKGFEFEVTNFGSMDKVKYFRAVVPKSEWRQWTDLKKDDCRAVNRHLIKMIQLRLPEMAETETEERRNTSRNKRAVESQINAETIVMAMDSS